MDSDSGLLERNDYGTKWDAEDRLNFVRKVYSIVGFQILLTSLVTLIPMLSDSASQWMHQHYGLLIACAIGAIVINCAMICFFPLTRMVPINYILLLMFTICEAYLVASVAAVSDKEAVLAAAFSTAAIVLAITVFSWFVKTDFTYLGPIMLIIGMTMFSMSIFVFVFRFKALKMVYCALGVILFSLYLLFDT